MNCNLISFEHVVADTLHANALAILAAATPVKIGNGTWASIPNDALRLDDTYSFTGGISIVDALGKRWVRKAYASSSQWILGGSIAVGGSYPIYRPGVTVSDSIVSFGVRINVSDSTNFTINRTFTVRTGEALVTDLVVPMAAGVHYVEMVVDLVSKELRVYRDNVVVTTYSSFDDTTMSVYFADSRRAAYDQRGSCYMDYCDIYHHIKNGADPLPGRLGSINIKKVPYTKATGVWGGSSSESEALGIVNETISATNLSTRFLPTDNREKEMVLGATIDEPENVAIINAYVVASRTSDSNAELGLRLSGGTAATTKTSDVDPGTFRSYQISIPGGGGGSASLGIKGSRKG